MSFQRATASPSNPRRLVNYPPVTPPGPQLSAFVGSVRDEFERQLRELLGVEADLSLDFHITSGWDAGGIGKLEVMLQSGDSGRLMLDIQGAEPQVRSFASGGGLTLSYRKKRDGSDPYQEPTSKQLLEKLKRRFNRLSGDEPAVALAEGVRRQLSFADVHDWMYRTLGPNDGQSAQGFLRLGFRCNQDCGFCWQGRHWGEPPVERYLEWLEELAQHGVTHLTISGGEPTLHAALPEVIQSASKKHGMSVTLETNAIRLRREAYLKTLIDSGLAVAFVSFHSADPEISDAMTRSPGTHKGTVSGIESCLRLGVPLILNCVVNRDNYQVLEEHARFIVERLLPQSANGVSRVIYSHPSGGYDSDIHAQTTVPLEKIQPYLTTATRALRRAGIAVESVGPCGFPPCLFHEDPASVRLLKPDQYFDPGRVYMDICEGCAMRPHCLGIRGEYLVTDPRPALRPFETIPDEALAAHD